MQQSVKRVLKRNQYPSLLTIKIRGRCVLCIANRLLDTFSVRYRYLVFPDETFITVDFICPGDNLCIKRLRITSCPDNVSDCHRKQRADGLANGMNMCNGGILACPFCDLRRGVIRAEDAEGTYPHQRAV